MNRNTEIAYSYWEGGLAVMPKKKDEKRAALSGWKKFSKRLPTHEEFESFNFEHGVCIATGYSSRNADGNAYLEVFDFDNKSPDLNLFAVLQEWMDMIHDMNESLAKKLVIIQTPSGGYHVPVFCSHIEKSQKLAVNPDNTVLIETRGIGGLVVSYPSTGYEIIHNASEYPLSNIPTVTQQERALMFAYARYFDKQKKADVASANKAPSSDFVSVTDVVSGKVPNVPQKQTKTANNNFEWVGTTPFEDYNSRGNALDVLERHGIRQQYRKGDKIVLKRDGTDAKSSGYWFTDSNLMYLFSTSTVFEAEKAYTQSAILCKLEFNDDWKACFKHLVSNGFGDKQPDDRNTYTNNLQASNKQVEEKRPYFELAWEFHQQKKAEAKAEKEKAAKAELHQALKELQPVRYSDDVVLPDPLIYLQGVDTPILRHGQLALVMGRSGTRKTSLLYALIATLINNTKSHLGFTSSSPNARVLLIDTEQSEYSLVSRLRWIYKLSGKTMNDNNFRCFAIDSIRTSTRADFIKTQVEAWKPTVIVVDGLLDLTLDANSLEHAQNTFDDVKEIMNVCKSTFIGVLHENQGASTHAKMVGHLGSTFDRKSELTLRTQLDTEDETLTIVSCQKRRDGAKFKPFTFRTEDGRFERVADEDNFSNAESPFSPF